MNVWSFIGNLGGDAELKYTPAGTAVAEFSVAVSSGYGQNKSTTWARCSLFGARAEKLTGFMHKGDRIGVTGEARLDTWTNRDGQEKSALRVNVNDVTLLGGDHERQEAPKPRAKEAQPPSDFGFGDDLNF